MPRRRDPNPQSHLSWSGGISGFLRGCLPLSWPPAFQDVFRLFSSGPAGTVDMRHMKIALRNVGIQLSPQEMCEAVQQADLDGGCPNLCPPVLSLL